MASPPSYIQRVTARVAARILRNALILPSDGLDWRINTEVGGRATGYEIITVKKELEALIAVLERMGTIMMGQEAK